jgi:hypothetical protein
VSTNILDKYRLPNFAPETETGAAPAETPPPPAGGGAGAAEKPLSIRESLTKGFDDARKAQEPKEPVKKGKSRDDRGKFAAGEDNKRAADAMREATDPAEGAEAAPAEGEEPAEGTEAAPAAAALPVPAAWAKEAKAEWEKLPPAVQQAVTKREEDVKKGVDELKGKYADLDQALAPHIPVIRQHGHTPAQAVQQMFSWFQALSANPDAAFPALQKSFNWQPKVAAAAAAAQPGTAAPAVGADGKPVAPAAAAQPEAVSPAVQQYIDGIRQELLQLKQGVGQQLGTMQQSFAAQQEAKTQEILGNWAKDKPHFEKVRGVMAQLIQSGAVPLKEGRVDLDGAYEKAVRLNDEIWQQTQADAQAKAAADLKAKADAKKKADEAAAAGAKKAAVSLTPTAPGSAPAQQGKAKKKQSVRESLMSAIDEVRAE